jgi:cytoskeleton protein RodZ
MTNLGATFKKAREAKGIPLTRIAAETRISTRFLEAIEKEEFHLLPGGIFNRGFIRAYAERVGLDPDAALTEYEQLVNTQEPDQHTLSIDTPASRKKERNFYPVAIGALVLAIIIFYIVTRDSGPQSQTAPPPAAAVTEPAPSTPLNPSVAAAPEPEPVPAPPAPTTTGLALDVEATAQTWIKVTTDGNVVVPDGEILEPGMTRRFTAGTSLTLVVGNAAGLSLKLNDQKMKPLGKSGQVREIVITPSNLKDFIG